MGAHLTPDRLDSAQVQGSFSSVLRWLTVLPALRGVPRADLARLASSLRLVSYPAGHDLLRGQSFSAADPLRLVVHGRILRGSALQREQSGAWSARCGSVVGLGAINAWALARGLDGAWAHATQARHDIHCQTRVWVLELDAGRFDDVLGGERGAPLREHLLSLVPADVDAEAIVAALRATPRLRRVRVGELFRLTESARSTRLRAGDSLQPKAETARFVVAGNLEVCTKWGIERLASGELESLDRLGNERLLRAPTEATVVELLLHDEDLPPDPLRAPATVILADPEASIDAAKASERLRDALTAELAGAVGLVRVVWGGGGRADQQPSSSPTKLVLQPGEALERALATSLHSHLRRWGPFFDHLVVDTSAVARSKIECAQVWTAVSRTRKGVRLSYLFDQPRAWSQLPERLGLLPPVDVVPGAVLQTPPKTGPRVEAPEPNHEEVPEAIARWLARRLTPVRRSQPGDREPWPLDAVRLNRDDPRHDRPWARAVTSRRVALALGGAGAQAFIAVPLLRRLRREGVPIDLLAGTSIGAFVSVLYALDGESGLDHLEREWPNLLRTVWSGMIDNRWLEAWLREATRDCDLSDLPLPTAVISTEAHDLRARVHTHGSARRACLASGSMPPLAPMFAGDVRLVDGALTANVPAALMRSAGADVVVGVQPIPPVSPDPGFIRPPRSRLGERVRTYNPLLRYWDFARSYLAFARRAAQHGAPQADVVFHGSIQRTLAVAFWQTRRIVDHAETSDELERTVEATLARWRELCRPADRLRVDAASGRVTLGLPIDPVLDAAQVLRLPEHARAPLGVLARWLETHPGLRLRATLFVEPAYGAASVEITKAIETAFGAGRITVACKLDPASAPRLTLDVEGLLPCNAP